MYSDDASFGLGVFHPTPLSRLAVTPSHVQRLSNNIIGKKKHRGGLTEHIKARRSDKLAAAAGPLENFCFVFCDKAQAFTITVTSCISQPAWISAEFD